MQGSTRWKPYFSFEKREEIKQNKVLFVLLASFPACFFFQSQFPHQVTKGDTKKICLQALQTSIHTVSEKAALYLIICQQSNPCSRPTVLSWIIPDGALRHPVTTSMSTTVEALEHVLKPRDRAIHPLCSET